LGKRRVEYLDTYVQIDIVVEERGTDYRSSTRNDNPSSGIFAYLELTSLRTLSLSTAAAGPGQSPYAAAWLYFSLSRGESEQERDEVRRMKGCK
jgi:hypothetical protein